MVRVSLGSSLFLSPMEIQSLFFFPCSVTTSLLPLRNPPNFSLKNPNSSSSFSSSLHLFRCYSTKWRPRRGSEGGSYWSDSNAEEETFRNERSKFSFEESEEDDDDDDDDEDIDNGSWFRRKERQRRRRNWWSDGNSVFNQGSEILEDAIDNIWIFKVFSAFGWLLPAIIISFLLATGPKAFLMALALPLGQTAISYALDKVFGSRSDNPKPRSRTKRKPFSRATRTATMSEEEEAESPENSKGSSGYQSWVTPDDDSVEKKNNQRDPSIRRDASFGGWDDLDKKGTFDKGSTRRPTRTASGRPRAEAKGKLSRRGRNKSTPLLIRLLIAVFPFLGSWTRML